MDVTSDIKTSQKTITQEWSKAIYKEFRDFGTRCKGDVDEYAEFLFQGRDIDETDIWGQILAREQCYAEAKSMGIKTKVMDSLLNHQKKTY